MEGNALRNFWQNTTTTQKVAILVIPLGMVVIVAVAVVSLLNQQATTTKLRQVEITNYGEQTKAPKIIQEYVEDTIWGTLKNYGGVKPIATPVKVTIRNGSVSEYKASNNSTVYDTKFIVDMPSVEHSYVISFAWSEEYKPSDDPNDNDFEVFIDCPYYYDVIYKNTKCKVTNNPYDLLGRYLPYRKETESGTMMRLAQDKNDDGDDYIAVFVNTCGDESKLDEAEPFVEAWLEERLLDVDDYAIEAYGVCEKTSGERTETWGDDWDE